VGNRARHGLPVAGAAVLARSCLADRNMGQIVRDDASDPFAQEGLRSAWEARIRWRQKKRAG